VHPHPHPKPKGCTGNCTQRACDCQADLPDDFDTPTDRAARATFWRVYGALALAALITLACALPAIFRGVGQ
jgi:anti-sigma-K factor RskA